MFLLYSIALNVTERILCDNRLMIKNICNENEVIPNTRVDFLMEKYDVGFLEFIHSLTCARESLVCYDFFLFIE